MTTSTHTNNHPGATPRSNSDVAAKQGRSDSLTLTLQLREPLWTQTTRVLATTPGRDHPPRRPRDRDPLIDATPAGPTLVVIRESNDYLTDLALNAESWRNLYLSSRTEACAALQETNGRIPKVAGDVLLFASMAMLARSALGSANTEGERA